MFPHEGLFWENSSWTFLCNDKLNNEGVTNHNKVTLEQEHAPIPTPIPTPTPTPPQPSTRKRSRKGKEIMVDNEDDNKCEENQNSKVHILTERERRKKMKTMFTGLHSLLPQLSLKADKSSIVDAAVNQIKSLQSTLERLQKEKQDRLQGGTTPNSLINDHHATIGATSKLAMLSLRETFMADQVSAMNNSKNSDNTTGASSSSSSSHYRPVMIQTWTSPNVVLNICGDDAHFVVFAPKKQGILTGICEVLENYKLEVVSVNISSDAYRCNYTIQARVANGVSDGCYEAMNVEEIYKQAAADIMLWASS